jgi:hypothetical protein
VKVWSGTKIEEEALPWDGLVGYGAVVTDGKVTFITWGNGEDRCLVVWNEKSGRDLCGRCMHRRDCWGLNGLYSDWYNSCTSIEGKIDRWVSNTVMKVRDERAGLR